MTTNCTPAGTKYMLHVIIPAMPDMKHILPTMTKFIIAWHTMIHKLLNHKPIRL